MRVEVRMAKFSYDMESAGISKWHKQVGDTVQRGEAIVEIDADKSTVDLEATESGTLVEIAAPEGTEVPVGEVIAYIETSGVSMRAGDTTQRGD
jgi:pyruvate/2-oxoglutarate dehydrogenase complex dihydrolipoamide acyltransferase (E2) component